MKDVCVYRLSQLTDFCETMYNTYIGPAEIFVPFKFTLSADMT